MRYQSRSAPIRTGNKDFGDPCDSRFTTDLFKPVTILTKKKALVTKSHNIDTIRYNDCMANIVEIGLDLLAAIPTKAKVVGGAALLGGAVVARVVLGGEGNGSSTALSDAAKGRDQTSTPALLRKTRTPTPAKSLTREPLRTSTPEARNSMSFTFDGVTYTTAPSDNNAACGTIQVPRYLMTDQQLRLAGLTRNDIVYMKRGQGQNNPKLAWYCGTNGQRIYK